MFPWRLDTRDDFERRGGESSGWYFIRQQIHGCGIYGRVSSCKRPQRAGLKILDITGIFRLNWRWILSREYFLHWLTSISTETYLYARKDCELFRSLLDASSTPPPCGLCFPTNFPSCRGDIFVPWRSSKKKEKKERKSCEIRVDRTIILGIIPRFPPYYIADLANVSRFLGRKKRILGSSFERKRKTRVAQQILRLRGSSLSLPFIYIYILHSMSSRRE